MKTVIVSGWKAGFQKIAFTELLRSEFGYSLSAAKAATDGVLSSCALELQVPGVECERLATRLQELSATFSVEEDAAARTQASNELQYSKP